MASEKFFSSLSAAANGNSFIFYFFSEWDFAVISWLRKSIYEINDVILATFSEQ